MATTGFRRIFKEEDVGGEDRFTAEYFDVADDQCHRCANYIEGTMTCKAFPGGIPVGFLTGEYDHTKPYEGDNGIRFEPKAVV